MLFGGILAIRIHHTYIQSKPSSSSVLHSGGCRRRQWRCRGTIELVCRLQHHYSNPLAYRLSMYIHGSSQTAIDTPHRRPDITSY